MYILQYQLGKSNPITPTWFRAVTALLESHKIPAASRRTFSDFILNITAIIGKAFTSSIISSGWRSSGLYPLDCGKMLGKIHSWQNMSNDEAQAVVTVIHQLLEQAKETGIIPDVLIQEKLGGYNFFRNEVATVAINGQRSLWLNKEGVLTLRMEQERMREQKEIEQQIKLQEQAERAILHQHQREAAAAAVADILVQVVPDVSRESNPIICAKSKYHKQLHIPTIDIKTWKLCNLCEKAWFCCSKKACVTEAQDHVAKCRYNQQVLSR